MPGFLYHLACANEVAKARPAQENERDMFFIGNILPDLATDKGKSHYRIRNQNGWEIPNLDQVFEELSAIAITNPYYAGIICHLILDYVFITDVLSTKYTLDDKTVFANTGQTWSIDDFLSKKTGFYVDYSAYNSKLFAQKLISVSDLSILDCPPPKHIFKNLGWQQNDRDLQKRLQDYLTNTIREPLGFFSYDEILSSIHKTTNIFIKNNSTFANS